MSINGVLNSAVSGLNASQTAMRTASTNIANVNTPGYARTQVVTAPLTQVGAGAGVEIQTIRRIADQFLQRAGMLATADAAGAERAFAMMDRLQAQFGSLDDPGSLFGRIDATMEPLTQLTSTPSSAGDRAAAVSAIQAVLDEAERLSLETRALRAEADARISASITRVNELLTDIAELNGDIQRGRLQGDATGAENAQAALIDELSGLLDVRATTKNIGGVELRTGDGQLLLGQNAATLEYDRVGSGQFGTAYSQIILRPGQGVAPIAFDPHIKSGEIAALIKMRDQELPAVAAELAELAAGYADALNAAHNQASAVPAENTLTGRNTGLLAADALGFSGQTSIGITDANGVLNHRIDIDFTAGTMSVDGGGPIAFGATVGGFQTVLNTQMGLLGGSASFTNGVLSLGAGAGEGVVIQQPETGGASRGGRGFSHFFGLNDVVSSNRPAFFETGMTGAEAHGFTAGQQLAFRVTGPAAGAVDVTVTIGGTTINDVLNQLNNPTTGLGRFGTFSLDANGALVMTPAAGAENFRVDLTGDSTVRAGTGVSFSQLFGVGEAARAGRADILNVRADIAANPAKLAAAAPDIISAAIGDFVLGDSDGRGALALHNALTGPRSFSAAGAIAGGSVSVTDFAARLAGDVGSRAARAERARDSAEALKVTADEQRTSVEGVNLDEELAAMTLYQQSYNASARLLQAAKEMMDTLLAAV